MEDNMKEETCIFCKIIGGDIPSVTAYEDDDFKVIFDVSPASRGHVLILPKEHVANIFEMSDEMAAKAICLAKKIATAMKEKLHCDGVNIVQNNGEAAGQTVFHFHMHVIPRYKGDNAQKNCSMVSWTPGKISPEEMQKIAAELDLK